MTSTFRERFISAQQWEHDLIERLREYGWLAEPFGQAQVKDYMREHLREWRDDYQRPTLIRWMPDILAVHPGRGELCLIDAKTETKSTDNYSIEVSAVDADESIERNWHTPVYYVWPDGGVLTPSIVRNRWNSRRDGKGANGSGTAFFLIDKSFALHASVLFGTQSRGAA